MELIKYENIDVTYKGKKAITGFNLSINKGDKVLLKGRSGTGKSTLFRLLLGFVRQSSGNVFFEDQPINGDMAWEIRKKMSHVTQNPDIGEGVVNDLINDVFSYKANKEKLDHNNLSPLMEYFDLDQEILVKKFEDLSGGEKQRVAIIISILMNREIYLLDEPTSALDPSLKKKVADLFLNKDKWTVFIISHDKEWEREGIKIIDLEDHVKGKIEYAGL